MSKGSNRRPTQISQEEADANWRAAFGESRLERMVREAKMEKAQEGDTVEGEVLPESSLQGQGSTGNGS